jgi:hypothetical protein
LYSLTVPSTVTLLVSDAADGATRIQMMTLSGYGSPEATP